MRIRWTPAAAADLQHISDYLKEHHPQYREPTLRKLYDTVLALKDAPYRGRPGREEGTEPLNRIYSRRPSPPLRVPGVDQRDGRVAAGGSRRKVGVGPVAA